ncbi:HdeD family acid-resistance protein [Maribellus mangrovi]|uniref:HdeD family acid-resistance protein n=1 Tax=Maribellus mangrovi TaxID=3133146 RepID=UPI0030EBE642
MNAANPGNINKQYWWIPLISGLTLLFFGIWFLLAPLDSFKSLTIVFGLIISLSGAIEMYIALKNRKVVINYLSFLWGGLLNVILGILLMLNPEAILWIISLVIGFWMIFKGGELIKRAFQLKKSNSTHWKRVLVFGILLIVVAAILLWHPEIIGFTIAIWTSLAFILIGVFRIYLALQFRKMND